MARSVHPAEARYPPRDNGRQSVTANQKGGRVRGAPRPKRFRRPPQCSGMPSIRVPPLRGFVCEFLDCGKTRRDVLYELLHGPRSFLGFPVDKILGRLSDLFDALLALPI